MKKHYIIASKIDILSKKCSRIESACLSADGKNFVVLSQEIRKLVDKTKNTYDNKINRLSVNGQTILNIAGKTIEKAIPEIIKNAELVNYIASSEKEKQSEVEYINISVQQLTEITNENSALSEEVSA